MKLFTKFLWSMLPLLSMVFMVSCEDVDPTPDDPKVDPKPEVESAVINLKAQKVVAEADGGEYTINYTITNPVEGVVAQATTESDWVTSLDTSEAGVIKFNVLENDVEQPRVAVVEVSYADADVAKFTVEQAAALPASYTFTVEMLECSYFSAMIDVYPGDEITKYLVGIWSMEEVEEAGLDTDDALFNYDMEYKAWFGSWYGQSAMDVAREQLHHGAIYDLKLKDLQPATEYLFYAFYYDPDTGERLSDIHRYTFTTLSVDLTEQEFNVSYDIVGPNVDVTISPKGYDGPYYFDMIAKKLVDDECAAEGITLEEYFERWWITVTEGDRLQGAPPAIIISNSCSYGEDNYLFELLADTDYYLFAFAVNDWSLCSSVPYYEVVHTGTVEASDMIIRVIVSDITAYGADFTFRPTSDEESYVAGWATLDEWNSFGSTDRARLASILKQYNFEYIYGEYTHSIDRDLSPDTKYVVFAFGYYGGVVTTDLFSSEFKTLPEMPSEVTVSIKDMGYFDIDAVNAIDPTIGNLDLAAEYAVYPVEFEVSDEDAVVYYYNWEVGPYDDPQWYTDENMLGRMLYWGERPKYICEPVAYDYENWLGAIAKDELGFYSDRFLYKFPCNRSGVNPDAQIFVDWYNEHRDIIEGTESVVYSSRPMSVEAPFKRIEYAMQTAEKARYSEREQVAVESTPVVAEEGVLPLQRR